MLALNPQIPIYLHTQPIDMRKSYDGLFGIVRQDLACDVRSGGLFVFFNLRLNRIKILYWDGDGLAIWMKRLERGCFQRPLRTSDGLHVMVPTSELQAILAGIDLKDIKLRKRYVASA